MFVADCPRRPPATRIDRASVRLLAKRVCFRSRLPGRDHVRTARGGRRRR